MYNLSNFCEFIFQPNGTNSKRNPSSSSSTTTTLNLTDDDMIDITPRDSINYNQQTMAGDPNFHGSASSPTHSAFAREFNEPDGECAFKMFNFYIHTRKSIISHVFSSLHVLHHCNIVYINFV